MNSKLIIPDLGVDAAEVVEIAVKVGDSIQAEQDILTLETDKASMEVPASVGGTISELTIAVGDSVTSGQVIGQCSLLGAPSCPLGAPSCTRQGQPRRKPKAPHPHPPKKDKEPTEPPTAIPLELSAPEETTTQLLIPDLGVDSAEVVEIAIKVGDSIEPEQEILTLETDKASMEVPANVGGTVQELSIAVGDNVHSGQSIGLVLGAGVGAPSCTRPGSQGDNCWERRVDWERRVVLGKGRQQGNTQSTTSPPAQKRQRANRSPHRHPPRTQRPRSNHRPTTNPRPRRRLRRSR